MLDGGIGTTIDGDVASASVAHGHRMDESTLTEWQLVDRRLRTYRYHRAQLDAAELFDLARAESMKVHWTLGHSTMLEYMEFALGYTPHVARERLRVARALNSLPATAGSVHCA